MQQNERGRINMRRIFSRQADKIESVIEKSIVVEDRPLKAEQIQDGYILPLRKVENGKNQVLDGTFCGGVAAKDFTFAAGVERNRKNPKANYSCKTSYRPEGQVPFFNETVVFGGVLYGHYGHSIVDGLTRMWWFVEHPDTEYRFIFVRMPGRDMKNPEKFLELLGLEKERYEIIDDPRQYRQIIIPEEGFFSLESCINTHWLQVPQRIAERADAIASCERPERVYFTRTAFPSGDGVGEEYYEDFFRNRGYTVVSPEKLPVEDQIAIYRNARSIVCVNGTLAHAALFAREGTQLILLLKCDTIVKGQLAINAAMNFDWYMVEAHRNFLPTNQAHTACIYTPTIYFEEFLIQQEISYDKSDFTDDRHFRETLYDYIKTWARRYENPHDFYAISDGIYPLLRDTNREFRGIELDKSQYSEIASEKYEAMYEKYESKSIKKTLQAIGYEFGKLFRLLWKKLRFWS